MPGKNKFQISVQQRLEQEQKVPPKAQTKTVKKAASAATEKKVDVSKPKNEPVQQPVSDLPDISEFLQVEPQRVAKNKTFYLDEKVIDALSAAAKKQGVPESKLCNNILRRVLGVKGN